MRVSHSPYELKFKTLKNKSRQGTLLRLEFEDKKVGYADLFPWPEFRDEPLSIQIQNLKQGKLSPLLKKSFEFARQDAEARNENKSLFEGLTIPRSHFLFMTPDIRNEEIEKLISEGYKTIKVKLEDGTKRLNDLPNELDIKFRLDFNGKLTEQKFYDFVENLSPIAKGKIEFVEDPTPFNNDIWLRLMQGLPLALDCGSDLDLTEVMAPGFNYLIIKPARQTITNNVASKEIAPVFMGYLDHPVGQSFAALEAARWQGKKLDAGLTYHQAYQKNEYSECLSVQSATLVPDRGAGIGFGELLEKEDWEVIYEN